MIYETLLAIGAIGFAAQLALGFAHGGDHGSHGGHNGHAGHAGHSHAEGGIQGHGGGHHDHGLIHHHSPMSHHAPGGGAPAVSSSAQTQAGHNGGHRVEGERGGGAGALALALTLLSPMTLFGMALGAGATGLLLGPYLSSPLLTALAAALGGIAFVGLIVRPLQRLALSFASKPARTLSGIVTEEVEAATRFDERGRGIVTATVDGQVVRVLAHLEADDRTNGVTVSPGDRLVVTSVEEQKNVCRVTRL